MPFYLDRHEVDEPLSPKEVAMAHYNDVLIQEEHDCKVMTYWRGDDNKSAYCLIHAPSPEKLKALHAASHGMIPNEIIEVDLAEVEAVLGRTSDPLPLDSEQALQDNIDEFSEAIDSAFRVIMFTDLKDSTLMTTELGQEKALELLITHNKIIRKVLKEHHGTEVKHTGDGLMVSFINVPDSLACACGIQDAFAEYNTNNPEDAMYVRVGLSAGEPVFESNDFFGYTVNLAKRLCDHTDPGSVLVSAEIHENRFDTPFVFTDLGCVMLKGFKEAVQVYQVDKP